MSNVANTRMITLAECEYQLCLSQGTAGGRKAEGQTVVAVEKRGTTWFNYQIRRVNLLITCALIHSFPFSWRQIRFRL